MSEPVHPLIQTARGHVADEDWAGAEHDLGLAVDRAKDLEAEVEQLRDRLTTMNECVRIYVNLREAGTPARRGWLEEEVAATDALLDAAGKRARQ